MSTTKTALGVCPFCGAEMHPEHVLIEYEAGVFAECPDCREPVNPE